ncbi:unnamed protein product [Paramecium sonneborni]|uniref:Uncharacterized protein n=1 Tax=Paramecium sonneborni TaxID=65129 RepID=A0A8S1N1R6_9CILI|nr:unnamed protein product [Paramecium sonneborni]
MLQLRSFQSCKIKPQSYCCEYCIKKNQIFISLIKFNLINLIYKQTSTISQKYVDAIVQPNNMPILFEYYAIQVDIILQS